MQPINEDDLEQERDFRYKGLSQTEIIIHISRFISGIWRIHPFPEGNTRTTAVFAIKYLSFMGYAVENDMFKSHSWYFRNALVRANYRNAVKGIEPTLEYLVLFFRNLLLGENNELKSRYLHIRWSESKHQNDVSETPKQNNSGASTFNLTEKEWLVANLMSTNNQILIDTLVDQTQLSRRTIDRIIKSLKDKGVLERKGVKNLPE